MGSYTDPYKNPPALTLKFIDGTPNTWSTVKYMDIDYRRFDIIMTKKRCALKIILRGNLVSH